MSPGSISYPGFLDLAQSLGLGWPAAYTLLAFLMIGLAHQARSCSLQKLSMLMLLSCAGSNALFYWWPGRAEAPVLITALDALICVGTAGLAIRHNSLTALRVSQLFVVEAFLHIVTFATATQATSTAYTVFNLIYVAQQVCIGGASAERIRLRGDGRVAVGHRHHGVGRP